MEVGNIWDGFFYSLHHQKLCIYTHTRPLSKMFSFPVMTKPRLRDMTGSAQIWCIHTCVVPQTERAQLTGVAMCAQFAFCLKSNPLDNTARPGARRGWADHRMVPAHCVRRAKRKPSSSSHQASVGSAPTPLERPESSPARGPFSDRGQKGALC